jgi:hypothetical protein
LILASQDLLDPVGNPDGDCQDSERWRSESTGWKYRTAGDEEVAHPMHLAVGIYDSKLGILGHASSSGWVMCGHLGHDRKVPAAVQSQVPDPGLGKFLREDVLRPDDAEDIEVVPTECDPCFWHSSVIALIRKRDPVLRMR